MLPITFLRPISYNITGSTMLPTVFFLQRAFAEGVFSRSPHGVNHLCVKRHSPDGLGLFSGLIRIRPNSNFYNRQVAIDAAKCVAPSSVDFKRKSNYHLTFPLILATGRHTVKSVYSYSSTGAINAS